MEHDLQVRIKRYLPGEKIYLCRTTGWQFFQSCTWPAILFQGTTSWGPVMYLIPCNGTFSRQLSFFTIFVPCNSSPYPNFWTWKDNSNAFVELLMAFTSSRILQWQLPIGCYLWITLHVSQVKSFVGFVVDLTSTNSSTWTFHKFWG